MTRVPLRTYLGIGVLVAVIAAAACRADQPATAALVTPAPIIAAINFAPLYRSLRVVDAAIAKPKLPPHAEYTDMVQSAAAELALLRNRVETARDSERLTQIAPIIRAYEDADAVWRRVAAGQYVGGDIIVACVSMTCAPGTAAPSAPLSAIATRYGLPVSEDYAASGVYKTVPHDSVRRILRIAGQRFAAVDALDTSRPTR